MKKNFINTLYLFFLIFIFQIIINFIFNTNVYLLYILILLIINFYIFQKSYKNKYDFITTNTVNKNSSCYIHYNLMISSIILFAYIICLYNNLFFFENSVTFCNPSDEEKILTYENIEIVKTFLNQNNLDFQNILTNVDRLAMERADLLIKSGTEFHTFLDINFDLKNNNNMDNLSPAFLNSLKNRFYNTQFIIELTTNRTIQESRTVQEYFLYNDILISQLKPAISKVNQTCTDLLLLDFLNINLSTTTDLSLSIEFQNYSIDYIEDYRNTFIKSLENKLELNNQQHLNLLNSNKITYHKEVTVDYVKYKIP